MRARRSASTLIWLLVAAIGCAGDGCGGCMEPIPGGFPPAERASNAITTKMTKDGLDQIQGFVSDMIVQQLGATTLDLPCTVQKMSQTVNVPIVGPQTVSFDAFICDLDESESCTAADATHPSRTNGNMACQAAITVDGIELTPTQNVSGSVDIVVEVQLRVNTGKIPLRSQEVPLLNCNIGCTMEYDTDLKAPEFLPVLATMRMSVDPARGDILTFQVPNINDITSSIDTSELQLSGVGSGCANWACDLGNLDFVKELLFGQIQGELTLQLREAVDSFRCLPCAQGTNACPGSSTCSDTGLCYDQYAPNSDPAKDVRVCVPNLLGVEGRADVGAMLGGFGGGGGKLDVSVVAGGRNADGKPSIEAPQGSLVLGMLGGTGTPARALCVPDVGFTMSPMPAPMNFDAELGETPPGMTSVAGYHLGLALSDRFLDKSLYDVWAAGTLCLDLGQEQVSLISTGLFSTFVPSLHLLTQGRDVPMLISLRPFQPPSIRIGRGTVKDGPKGPVPDDALLTIEMPELHVDFYGFIDERYARLFTLAANVKLPLSLEFDVAAGTVTPVLGELTSLLGDARGINNEMLAEDPQALAAVLDSVIGLVEPQLAGALSPIALPEMEGFKLEVLGARGSVPKASGGGFEHMALFTKLSPAAAPFAARFDAQAQLVGLDLPSVEALRAGEYPVVRIDASASGLTRLGFEGHEYSWRVNGGFWTPWTDDSRLAVSAPVLRLQGRHFVDVRVREKGVVESTDLTPARVWVDVDWEAPTVSLRLDRTTGEVITEAHDLVTPVEELSFRYRLGEQSWSSAGGARAFTLAELGDDPFLEVEVTDAAGHVATARFGSHATAQPVTPLATFAGEAGAGGCATGAAGLFALVGLAAALRRRRR